MYLTEIPCPEFGQGIDQVADTSKDAIPIENLVISYQVYTEIIRQAFGSYLA